MKPRLLWTGLAAITLCLIIAGPLLATLTDTTRPELKTPPLDAASASVSHFFDRYLDAHGQVVDANKAEKGGDLTADSRAQGYALLLSAAAGERERFDLVWEWTRSNLQQTNGLLATSKQDAVVDPTAVSVGANLDVARALAVASHRFGDAEYADQARRIGNALLAERVESTPNGGLYLGDVFGADKPEAFVPGDHAPRTIRALHELTGDQRWRQILETQREIVAELLDETNPRLPPELAEITANGEAVPRDERSSSTPRYADDAARLPARLAESCDQGDKTQAMNIWTLLNRSRDTRFASELDLDGSLREPTPAVISAVASAAGAKAAVDELQMYSLLDAADDLEKRNSSVHGAAWAALGRVMLTTTWLGQC